MTPVRESSTILARLNNIEGSKMKVAVILDGGSGELDRQEITACSDDEMNQDVKEVIQSWVLSSGDTIRIIDIDE